MQNDISSLYIDLSQTKKKTSNIVGARHAGHPKKRCPFFGDPDSPLSRLTPCGQGGDECVALTSRLGRAVAREEKTSKIEGARHASPLSRLMPLRPEGDACVAPTFPLCRAVAATYT